MEYTTQYFLPTGEIKDSNVMISGNFFLDQQVKTDLRIYDNIRKRHYFKKHYKMISIDLSKQKALDADPKEIQQTNFTGNLNRPAVTKLFFIIKEVKENILDSLQEAVRLLSIY